MNDMNKIFVIEETIIDPKGNKEVSQVCAAQSEEKAKEAVEFLTNHAYLSTSNADEYMLSYSYRELFFTPSTSWLVDLKK